MNPAQLDRHAAKMRNRPEAITRESRAEKMRRNWTTWRFQRKWKAGMERAEFLRRMRERVRAMEVGV